MTDYDEPVRRDAFGNTREVIPKLNTLLLEQAINWATRSHLNQLEPSEPIHYQESWGLQVRSKYLRQWREALGVTDSIRDLKDRITPQKKGNHYCGTSFCIAGYGVEMTSGVRVTNVNSRLLAMATGPQIDTVTLPEEIISWNDGVISRDDLPLGSWNSAGAAVYGLTHGEALHLFKGDNTIWDIREYAQKIAAHRGETLNLIPLDEPAPAA